MKYTLTLLAALLLAPLASLHATDLTNLRCEYRIDPLGIDVARPRLSWMIESARRGERQTAYQVLVASTPEKLAEDQGDLWDSGKVASNQSTGTVYQGRPLRSRTLCYWKVMIWDKDDKPSAWSQPASWSMGLLEPDDWKAQWIAATADDTSFSSTSQGYHAAEASAADQAKWVQVDLGKPVAVDAVTLHPMNHAGRPGFGFPLRFTITASDDPSFASSTVIADQSQADYPNPGHRAVRFKAESVTTRYVRVTVTRLRNRGSGPRPFCFALAELEVFSGDKNLALHAPVTAHDSVEAFGWGREQLTDGQNLAPRGDQSGNTYASRSLPIFRREFQAEKLVARAVLYACGLGQAEFRLNGHKIGDDLLQPGWTNYRKSCLYQTYDVTQMIRRGPNALGVLLGNGMYNVQGGRYAKFKGSFGPPKLIAQLEIDYADGTRDMVVTDGHHRLGDAQQYDEHPDRLSPPRATRLVGTDSLGGAVIDVPLRSGRHVLQDDAGHG